MCVAAIVQWLGVGSHESGVGGMVSALASESNVESRPEVFSVARCDHQASPSVRGSLTLRGEISGSPSYGVHPSLAGLHAFRPCHEFPGAKLGCLCFHLCFLSKNTVWATLTSEQPILPLHIPDQQHNFATPATTHTTFSAVNPTSTRQEAPARGFPNAIALGGPSFSQM